MVDWGSPGFPYRIRSASDHTQPDHDDLSGGRHLSVPMNVTSARGYVAGKNLAAALNSPALNAPCDTLRTTRLHRILPLPSPIHYIRGSMDAVIGQNLGDFVSLTFEKREDPGFRFPDSSWRYPRAGLILIEQMNES